ncbi:Transcription factor E2FB -like protein [Carex littledalei]|uniref:Transcription factor E2FB -like protein n=1 Tax=Carex littledalei TaxID=544730 RepID=A0A833Q9G0_9POAL|nr:Transcription factor E2FB -like protein [Carex littledalei]
MADDPPEHDRPEGVTVPVRRSLPFFTAQSQFAPSGEYHQFPETIAGHSPVVINATPMKRKMEMKDRRTSGTGNEESPCNSTRTPNTCRFDSSLVRVTKKFLELFDKAPDSSLDLNKAAETLEVPKRRLYDITGVLEGIGLIEKKHKNAICWKIQEEPNSELNASVARLKASIEDLISKEHELDEQISEMQGRIKKFIEDEKTQKLLFLKESDLKGLPGFKNQTLIAVRAPPGTTLEVPDPDQMRYRFIVRSNAGPIQVHLVSKLEEDFGGAAENSMACLGANVQSETIPSDDANPDVTDYWLSSDPGFSISDLWDLSREGEVKPYEMRFL